jgi:hypothetical protein
MTDTGPDGVKDRARTWGYGRAYSDTERNQKKVEAMSVEGIH